MVGGLLFIYILAVDIIFIVVLIDILRAKDWRVLIVSILNILAQNLVLGIIKFMPYSALIVSIFFSGLLIAMIFRKYRLKDTEK